MRRVGQQYVQLICLPQTLAITRTAVAEAGNSKLGALLYERGPGGAVDRIADFLSRLMEKGQIRSVEPRIAALHLKGLLDARIQEPLLFGAVPELAIEQGVDAAVDTFLKAYSA